MERFAPAYRMLFSVLALSIGACGGDLTLPDPPVAGVALHVVNGNEQQGTVGEPLPDVVVVEVKTEVGGEPVPGRRVAFLRASGDTAEAFQPDTAITNADGQAFTRWKLGTAPGTYSAEARIVTEGDTAVIAVPLQADAVAGDPDTLRADGATSRPGRREQQLDDPLKVVVVDRFGNPVEGADVEWKLTGSDDGSLSAEHTPTGPDGSASVVWTLGSRAGVQQAQARVSSVSGSPVTFTAVVLF